MLFCALTRPITECEYTEIGHGRVVNRRVQLYPNIIELPKGWNGIERFVKVRRWGTRNGKNFEEVSYYVLSKPINCAATVAEAIQKHWSIENDLHWNKDINIGEDDMSVRDTKTAAMLAYFNNVAVNILKKAGYKPVKATFAKFSNKVNELYKLFEHI